MDERCHRLIAQCPRTHGEYKRREQSSGETFTMYNSTESASVVKGAVNAVLQLPKYQVYSSTTAVWQLTARCGIV